MRSFRPAFTLIELLISIMIIALIVTYLYESLGILKKANEQLTSRDAGRKNEDQIKKLFILDLLQAKNSTIKIHKTDDKNFDLLELQTNNSLHNIKKPKISYLVAKKEKKLIRIEGLDYTLPLNREKIYSVKYDDILTNLTHFKIYQNKQKNRLLIAIKESGKALSIFEVLTP